ncbi:MAG: xylulokinase [Burkholderiaceae bacterium]|jgi:xylulokinase|nr:xylulokinase [Burkholderiaceae bacterium]MEB2318025.1 xylulokinase [Pseudomonadota bacterium]
MDSLCLMGIDIGAGSLKTMIVGADGAVLGSASADLATRTPLPGWSEQDPQDWWQALCTTVPRALAEAGIEAGRIAAVAFSAGAHTPVLEDEDGRVIRPAILWSDSRSAAEADWLQQRYGDEILEIACNRAAPTWTQPQLLWLARHEPEAFARVRRLYVAKDWLRSRLTGTWETDPTEAVGTLLYDGRRQCWSERMCEMIGLDPRVLPPIVQPTDVVGRVGAEAAAASGLATGTPVVCGSSDTSVECFGAGASAIGQGSVKLATAAAICIVAPEPRPSSTVINYPFCVPGLWYTIGATNSCASAHRWLRDTFFMDATGDGAAAFARMDEAAGQAEPGARGMIFHPYLQGERTPHWDARLRADFLGMSFAHERRHFVRALYEGIALSLRDVLEALRAQGLAMDEARIIGGGARSETWRQIVADVLGISILMPAVTDASFGAALIAGVGIGAFPDEATAAARTVRIVARHEPDTGKRALYDELHGIYRDAARQLVDINHRLTAVAAP